MIQSVSAIGQQVPPCGGLHSFTPSRDELPANRLTLDTSETRSDLLGAAIDVKGNHRISGHIDNRRNATGDDRYSDSEGLDDGESLCLDFGCGDHDHRNWP